MNDGLRGIGVACIVVGVIRMITGWVIVFSGNAAEASTRLEGSLSNGIGLLLIAVGLVCRKLAQK